MTFTCEDGHECHAQPPHPGEVLREGLDGITVTDLITGGLDVLTVARLAGTRAAMIEKRKA